MHTMKTAIFCEYSMLGRPFFQVSRCRKREFSADLVFSAIWKVIQAPFGDCHFRRCLYAGKTLFSGAVVQKTGAFCRSGLFSGLESDSGIMW